MIVYITHDNGVNGQRGISEEEISTLEDLLPLVQSYIQAGSCVYKLDVTPNREGESWT